MSFDRYRSDAESRGGERSGSARGRGRESDRFREEEQGQRAYRETSGERSGRYGYEEEPSRTSGGREERSWRPGQRSFESEEGSGRGRMWGEESPGEGFGSRFSGGYDEAGYGEARYRGSREAFGGRRDPWSDEDLRGREYGSYGSPTRMGGDFGYEPPRGGRYGSSSGTSYGSSMGSSSGSSMGPSYGSSRGFEGGRGSESIGSYGRSFSSSERGRFTGKGPKGYRRSDERIKEDVSDLLERNGEIDASEIEVQVVSGEVTLVGTVTERSEKRLAEDLIEDLPGVKQVHNRLRISSGNGPETSGSETSSTRSGTASRSGSSASTRSTTSS